MKITQLKGNPRYFNAKGLEPRDYIIESADIRTFNEEKRVVLTFVDEERELKLTPHQVSAIARLHGDDTEKWKGVKVHIQRAEGTKGIALTVDKTAQREQPE
jgi:hypothetical protein